MQGNTVKPGAIKSDGLKDKIASKTLHVLFLSLLIDLIAFSSILPLLPVILEHYRDTDSEDGLFNRLQNQIVSYTTLLDAPRSKTYLTVFVGGALGSIYCFLQFLAAPFFGAASDVYGRRPMMLLSMVGISLSYVVWAYSNSFAIFVLCRIIGGISRANVTLWTAIVSDVTEKKNRNKGMALIGIAFSIGFVLGPMLGAFISKWKLIDSSNAYFQAAITALVISVVNLIFVYFTLPETHTASKSSEGTNRIIHKALRRINPFYLFSFRSAGVCDEQNIKNLQKLSFVYFVYLLLYSGMEFSLGFLTRERYHYTSMQQGLMYFYIGAIMIIVQGGYFRRLPQGSEAKCAVNGIVAVIISGFLMAFFVDQHMHYVALTLYCFASATVVSSLTSLVSHYGSADHKGKLIGVFRSIGALARSFGPFLACSAYWRNGPLWCYSGISILFFIPLLVMLSVRKTTVKAY